MSRPAFRAGPLAACAAVCLLAPACGFQPAVNATSVVCTPLDDDGCPVGYTCDPDRHGQERNHCCADGNGDRACDDSGPRDGGAGEAGHAGDDAGDGPADDAPDAAQGCPSAGVCMNRTVSGDVCIGDRAYSHCEVMADGCSYKMFMGQECAEGLICADDYPRVICKCPPVPSACLAVQEGTYCQDPRTLATCGHDVNGCLTLTSLTDCPPAKPCAATGGATCSCPGASTCRGVGRTCRGDDRLDRCGLDGDGCLNTLGTTPCPPGSTCSGQLPTADCHCVGEACADQTVGFDRDLGASTVLPAGVLIGHRLVVPTAFTPLTFGTFVKGVPSTRVLFALYDTDAQGEPHQAVAWTNHDLALSALGDARLDIRTSSPPKPPTLGSGTYWLMVAFEKPTRIANQEGEATVPTRSATFTWTDPAPPGRVGGADRPVTRDMAPRTSFFMVVKPR